METLNDDFRNNDVKFCPWCRKNDIVYVGNGVYRCEDCGEEFDEKDCDFCDCCGKQIDLDNANSHFTERDGDIYCTDCHQL